MSNSYTEATAECIVPCDHDTYSRLSAILHDPANQGEDSHDFTVDWIDAHGGDPSGLYLCSVGAGNAQPDNLPLRFRVELGKLLSACGLPHLSIGLAFTCDKLRVNSHGGETVRLYPNGAVVRPTILWPLEAPEPQ